MNAVGYGSDMPTQTEPDVVISVKVPVSLRDAINAVADANDRTQAAEIRIAIRKHVADSPSRQED